jgi:hypothetical protein
MTNKIIFRKNNSLHLYYLQLYCSCSLLSCLCLEFYCHKVFSGLLILINNPFIIAFLSFYLFFALTTFSQFHITHMHMYIMCIFFILHSIYLSFLIFYYIYIFNLLYIYVNLWTFYYYIVIILLLYCCYIVVIIIIILACYKLL